MNIVLTGASRGIGESLTRSFVKEGDHRIFIIARNSEKLKNLAVGCSLLNPHAQVIPVPADLTKNSELKTAVEYILSVSPSIDILINNAGYALRKKFEEFTSGEIELLMNTNFHAPASIILHLLPALIRSGKSHVLNISSMSGFQGSRKFAGLTYYGASKAALSNLTETLSEEFKVSGVSFNCLAIGAVQTEMFAEVFAGYQAPLSPEKMAEFIMDFALRGHHFMNGKIIPVSLADP